MAKNKEAAKIVSFKKKLKKLLSDYHASIGFACGEYSDTYGLYDEHMVVDIDDKVVIKAQGWWLDATDI
ncbi:hypothetical protein DRJ25_04950 [Candidatus Woesearchaeota archaeon]|nr:MAG: hypothetical protein DRJ25_04950 [Candidatus Woesearchaeota archaeon]